MTELKVLVQRKSELSVDAINSFIASCSTPRLVLLYSSLVSEALCVDFFEECIQGLGVPFVGVRSSGCFTGGGFHEDCVVVGVLCGVFDVKLVCERIDYCNLAGVADKIISQVGDYTLAITHSANMFEQNVLVDCIFRAVNAAKPELQVVGGASSPSPIVACNEGMYSDHVVLALMRGVKFRHDMYSGFVFREDCGRHVVTGVEEHYVNGIDGVNAAEFISRKFRIMPYFLNMLVGLTSKATISQLFLDLSKANPQIEKAIFAGLSRPLGREIRKGLVDVYLPVKLYEKESRFLTTSHIPLNTVLRETETTDKQQIEVYKRIGKAVKDKPFLAFPCGALPTLFRCSNEKVFDVLKELSQEFIVAYMWGEFGTIMPYKSIEDNVVHGGSIQVLGFK